MKQSIRIASGHGFWGDWQRAPVDQARKGPIDYLVMDYLAEVTMSIMQKLKKRNPEHGYALDFVDTIKELLPDLRTGGFTVISNAGGANPEGCCRKILDVAAREGVHDLRIAVVTGDDLIPRLGELNRNNIRLDNMETGESFSTVSERVVSANAYFGAAPIADALKRNPDIIVTGRVTDTGLTLAPMMHEFNWTPDDWNRLAAGTIAGHINECGAQASGGNFTDWQMVPDLANVGFPLIEATPDGTFYVTKHDSTGGMVTEATVKEQLLYEIGNPAEYTTPDCIADFTSIQLSQDGTDRVRVSGISGMPATDFYKVSAAYHAGWKSTATLAFSWPDAGAKARAAARILEERLRTAGCIFDEFRSELIGMNALAEDAAPVIPNSGDLNEIMLRISVRGSDYESVERFGHEIAPLILTGPSGVTGFAGGRPKPSEVIAYWPALIPKSVVTPRVEVLTARGRNSET